MTSATRWWHTENDKVVCTLCPRECHIPLGSRGFCFVRANFDGRLELTTYGRSSGFCVDPIEKKPLNHFLPGTPVLSFGTAGCNLGCKFCQNWDISKSREMDRLADLATPEAIIQAAKQAGCRSVAFTYNDPTIWAEYAIDIAKVARREGIKTVAVTAGYISPEAREEFYQWMDAANVDLKAFTESFYRRLTQTHLEPVLDTLKYLKHHTDVWFEITNLVIPTENDSPEEIQRMCDWIVENLGEQVPVHFTAFHPDFKMRDHPRTPPETLVRAREQALAAGIKYAYVGNVDDVTNQTTYCGNCGATVIERNWYQLGVYNLDGNRCRSCGHRIPGVFDDQPGTWGRKRLPLRILNQPEAETTHMTTPDTRSTRNPLSVNEPVTVNAEQDGTPTDNGLAAGLAPKIDFTPEQADAILDYARQTARAAVAGSEPPDELPTEIADAPAYGLFVTLKRHKALRACRGRWGGNAPQAESPFGAMLQQVTRDTATMDPRFPGVTPEEIDLLNLEVSVMHSPAFLDAQGRARAEQVRVGTHGLVMIHPQGQGLLLPQVATEAKWDAAAFLDNLCRKANLPQNTWHEDPHAKVMTFQANVLEAGAPDTEPHPPSMPSESRARFVDAANRMLQGGDPAHPDDPALSTTYTQDLGLYLYTSTGLSAATVGPNHSLLDLARLATNSIKQFAAKRGGDVGSVSRATLLYQPIRLASDDYPSRHRYLAASAVVVRHQGRHAIALPDPRTRRDPIAQALMTLRVDPRRWPDAGDPAAAFRVTAFSVHSFTVSSPAPAAKPAAPTAPRKPLPARPAAQAGRFYPDDPTKMREQIDHCLDAATKNHAGNSRRFRAVMLPHAGWDYCGETLGKTLARVDVPAAAIVIGPKHTFDGPALSIAPHNAWAIPGGSVTIDTKMVDALAGAISGLLPEPDAHRNEHGSEVLLPFLHRLRPDIRVTPIVVGNIGYDATVDLGRLLAGVLEGLDRPPLLVISSDLNHFATQQENERRDRLALDALKTANSRTLYDTCRDNDISMCGLLPAVAVLEALNAVAPTQVEIVDYTNSATTTGDANRVVGYGGALLT